MRKVELESVNYITAKDNNGNIIIRCDFDATDCGEEESIMDFVARHGGPDSTIEYLKESYSNYHF